MFAQYEASHTGPLSTSGFEVVAYCKTRPGLDRPDAQLQIASFSLRPIEPGQRLEVE